MPSLLSVNVGMPQNVAWQGRTVYTSVWKHPVPGPRMVRRLNIDGDGQGDLAGHAANTGPSSSIRSTRIIIGNASLVETTSPTGSSGRISPSTACLTKRCALAIATG